MSENTTLASSSPILPDSKELKTIFFHNLSNKEISLIISQINKLYQSKGERRKLVFARTTEQSLQMKVEEWIEDTAEDHLYLLENPPTKVQKYIQTNMKNKK